MRLCHVSHSKAKQILNDAKLDTELFRYDSDKDILTAKGIMNFATEKKSRKGHDMISCYVVKINKKKNDGTNWTLSSLIKEFRKLMILNIVNGKERVNSLNVGLSKISVCRLSPKFTIAKGALTIGQSKTSFRRVRNELKNESRIKVTTHRTVSSFKDINEIPKPAPGTFLYVGNGIYATYSADTYEIINWEDNYRFKNVIFNHQLRIHSKHITPNMNDKVEKGAFQCCH